MPMLVLVCCEFITYNLRAVLLFVVKVCHLPSISGLFIYLFVCFHMSNFSDFLGCRGDEVEGLSETHDLCVGGDCIEMLQQNSAVHKVIPYVKVVFVHM